MTRWDGAARAGSAVRPAPAHAPAGPGVACGPDSLPLLLQPIGGPGLRVLFVGINPSLRSAEVGHNFARPGNRFWPTLHAAGFTPRQLAPQEDGLLSSFGLGLVNIVPRPTRAAAELSVAELRAGAQTLEATVRAWTPRLVAIVGVVAYRTAFRLPNADIGLQEEQVGGRPTWVLPNTSGLNAHYKPADFARLYEQAWRYAESLDSGWPCDGPRAPTRR